MGAPGLAGGAAMHYYAAWQEAGGVIMHYYAAWQAAGGVVTARQAWQAA